MTREDALQLLGLETTVTPADVEQALLDRVTQLESRISAAPTDALKDKYRRQLTDLETARSALLEGPTQPGLSQTQLADLPLAQASYTRSATGPTAAVGVGLKPGQMLAGRYEIQEQIGAGGMGAVYRAYDRNREKDIAIKVLLPGLLSSPKARERFLHEARLSSEMSHPHIVTVFDVQQDGPYSFLTMELLRGQSLRAYLKNLRKLRTDMAVDDALKITDQVCRALSYAHERTVHRDVKPENIWLTDDGKTKVMDFGIARLVETTQQTETAMALGTAYYMAPEQLLGRSDIDGRADQYAVAATLYEMLAGQVPIGRIESLKKTRKEIPQGVSDAVDRGLSQKPEQRHPTMEDFRAALHGRGLRLGGGGFKWLLVGGLAAALGGAAFVTYPSWKTLLPDRQAELAAKTADAAVKLEAARQQGEVKSLLKLLDNQRRDIKDAATAATREVERLDNEIRSARTPEEKAALQGPLLEALDKAALLAEVAKRVRDQLEGADGLPAIEGRINAAEAALKSNDPATANAQFAAVLLALNQMGSIGPDYQKQLLNARNQLIGQLDGKWGLKDCNDPSTWTVKNGNLQVYWPKMGLFEGKVVNVQGNNITVIVQNPAAQRGRIYRYTPVGARLDVEESGKGRHESLKKCG